MEVSDGPVLPDDLEWTWTTIGTPVSIRLPVRYGLSCRRETDSLRTDPLLSGHHGLLTH